MPTGTRRPREREPTKVNVFSLCKSLPARVEWVVTVGGSCLVLGRLPFGCREKQYGLGAFELLSMSKIKNVPWRL